MIILEELIRIFFAAGVAVIVSSAVHGHHEGSTMQNRHYQKQLQKIERDNLILQQKLFTQNTTENIKYIKIKEYIHDYANNKTGRSQLDAKFVRLHDISARPEMSDATSSAITHGATKATALNIISDNYQSCNEYKAKLIAWQEWYKNNQKTLNDKGNIEE